MLYLIARGQRRTVVLHVVLPVWAQARMLYVIARGQSRVVDLHIICCYSGLLFKIWYAHPIAARAEL